MKLEHVSPHPIAKSAQREAWGKLVSRQNASEDRVPPACAGYGNCGGCTLQHLSPDAQLRFKQQRISELLGGFGVVIPMCVAAAEPLGYRSRVKLTFAQDASGRLMLGSYAPRSHQVIEMSGCRVNLPALTALAASVVTQSAALGVKSYDEASGRGALRYLLLRQTASGAQQLGLVVANPAALSEAQLQKLAAALRAAHPRLESIVLHHNPSRGNALLSELPEADNDRLLFGQAVLWEDIGPVRLRISPRSFLQVNRGVAARIYADVASFVFPGAHVLDLYCGVGGLGLTVLSQVEDTQLYGIEGNPSAVRDATASAEAAGHSATRARFVCGDVAALLPEVPPASAPEVALLNPPRRGCDEAVLQALLARAPRRILYVSCGPESLARDLGLLCANGYRVRQITPYDMHPGTPHIETVTVLDRKTEAD